MCVCCRYEEGNQCFGCSIEEACGELCENCGQERLHRNSFKKEDENDETMEEILRKYKGNETFKK